MTEKLDIDHLRQWIGRSQEATDIVTAQLVKGLRATLFQEVGDPTTGDAAPLWGCARTGRAQFKLNDGNAGRSYSAWLTEVAVARP